MDQVTIDVNGERVVVAVPSHAASAGARQAAAQAAAASAAKVLRPPVAPGGKRASKGGAGTSKGGAGTSKTSSSISGGGSGSSNSAIVRAVTRLQALVRRRNVVRTLRHNHDKRQRIMEELLDTENNYVNHLRVLLRFYERPLRARLAGDNELLDEAQIDLVFAEISNLLDCHEVLLRQLRAKLDRWNLFQRVSDAFETVSETLQHCYQIYATQYEDAIDFLREQRARSQAFNTFLDDSRAASSTRLDLSDLLITPIQRFPHYKLLLGRLAESYRPKHPELSRLQRLIRRVHSVAQNMDERRREAEKRIEVRALDRRLRGAVKLVNTGRQVLREIAIIMINAEGNRQQRQLIIFNDAWLCVKVLTRASVTGSPMLKGDASRSTPPLIAQCSTSALLASASSTLLLASPGTPVPLAANAPPPALELEWFYSIHDMTVYPMVEPVKGNNFSDAAKAFDDMQRLEKAFEQASVMEKKAKEMGELYAKQTKSSTAAAWAQVEANDLELNASKFEAQLVHARALYNLNKAQVGLQITVNSGPDAGRSIVIAVDDVPTRDELRNLFLTTRSDSHTTQLQRSQTISQMPVSKVLLWHVQHPTPATGKLTSSLAASIAFVSVPILQRVNKLTFTLENPDIARQSDRSPSMSRRTPAVLRATASNKPRRAALSVRWTADVVAVTESSRSIVRLCVLNHAVVCGYAQQYAGISNVSSPSKKDTARLSSVLTDDEDEQRHFLLEWMCPVMTLSVTPFDVPDKWKDAGAPLEADVSRELRDLTRELEKQNQLLSGTKRIAAASAASQTTPLQRSKSEAAIYAKRTEDETIKKIESLKKEMEPLQRLLSLATAKIGVRIQVISTGQEYFMAFESAAARDIFVERFNSVRSASSKRITRVLYRASHMRPAGKSAQVKDIKRALLDDAQSTQPDASTNASSDSSSTFDEALSRGSQDGASVDGPLQREPRPRRPMEHTFSTIELDVPDNDPVLVQMNAEVQQLMMAYLKAVGSGGLASFKTPGLYIAKSDHLAETEEELMFLRGERVFVLKTMDNCWMCGCEGVVGTVTPNLLLNLSSAGLAQIPELLPASPGAKLYVAKSDHRKDSIDMLSFFAGEEVCVLVRDLPAPYFALGLSSNVLGWVDLSHLTERPARRASSRGL